MKPSEIIKKDLERRGIDPSKELLSIGKQVKLFNSIVLQEGDTIMVLTPLTPKSASMKMFSTSTPLRILSAFKVFMNKLEDSELNKIYFNITSPQNLTAMKRAGVNIENSDKHGFNFMALL